MSSNDVCQALFTHPTDDYDMLLELRASVLPRYAQNVIVNERAWTKDTKYSNLQSLPSSTSSKLVDFDPAALLRRDLQVRLAILVFIVRDALAHFTAPVYLRGYLQIIP